MLCCALPLIIYGSIHIKGSCVLGGYCPTDIVTNATVLRFQREAVSKQGCICHVIYGFGGAALYDTTNEELVSYDGGHLCKMMVGWRDIDVKDKLTVVDTCCTGSVSVKYSIIIIIRINFHTYGFYLIDYYVTLIRVKQSLLIVR